MVEQARNVARHRLVAIGGGIVQLLRAAVPSIIEQDDAPAVLGQGLDPLREEPVHRVGGSESVNQHDRLMPVGG